MVTRARLPLEFDPQPLRAEAEALPPDAWVPHFNTAYYEGDWSGVALRSVGGRDQQLYPDPAAADPFADTPTLGRCPGLAGALDRFECALLSARLLRLGPGASIREHRDHALGYDDGEIRIHIPLMTNPDVAFLHDGTRVDMSAGEAWYMNLNLLHAVRNESAEARVHLVVDCVVNDWLTGLLESGDA